MALLVKKTSKHKPAINNFLFHFSFFKKMDNKKLEIIQITGLIQKAKILDSMKNIRLRLHHCKKVGKLGPSISLAMK